MAKELLKKKLLSPPLKRKRLIKKSAKIIKHYAQAGDGLSGFSIKIGFKFFESLHSEAIFAAMEHLLPLFVMALEEVYEDFLNNGFQGSFSDFIMANEHKVCQLLLEVTDKKSESINHHLLKSTYQKLRPMALDYVKMALPEIAAMINEEINLID